MRKVNLNIRIEEELRDHFKKIAESKVQTPSDLIRLWIENYIKEETNMKKLVKLESLKEAVRKFLIDGQDFETSRGFQRAFIADAEGNVRLSAVLTATNFLENEENVIAYERLVNTWENQDMSKWFANEFKGELSVVDMMIILNNQLEKGYINKEELEEIKDKACSVEVLRKYNVAENFFKNDFMKIKQEELKEYWYKEKLEEKFVENYTEHILSQLDHDEWKIV